MTPRTEVDWIDADADADAIRARLLESPHTRLPVAEGSVENLIGVVQARDIVSAQFRGHFLALRQSLPRAEVVPDHHDAMRPPAHFTPAHGPLHLDQSQSGPLAGIVH